MTLKEKIMKLPGKTDLSRIPCLSASTETKSLSSELFRQCSIKNIEISN
jgi:hypothetical protein